MVQVIRAFLPAASLPNRSDDLASVYRGVLKGQRALILLEDSRDQRQVEPLLPPTESMLVVTSRRRFTLPAVHVLSLDRLDDVDGQVLLQSLAPRLDGAAARKVAELCEGVPLALQLAGSALRHRLDLTADAYVNRLKVAQSRYDLVEAVLSVSLTLLDPILQILWSRFGVFTTSFGFSDALQVSRGPFAVPEALSDLVAHGMLEHNPGIHRYSLPRSARRMAASLLTETERTEVEQRLAERRESLWDVGALDFDSFESTPRGLEGALSAARRAEYRPAEAIYLESIAGKLGAVPRAAEIAEEVLAFYRECGDRSGESRILEKLVRLHERLKNESYAVEFGEQALLILRELANRGKESSMLGMVCELHERLRNYRRAVELCEQNLTILRELGLRYAEGRALEILARLHEQLRDDHRAAELQQESLAIARERGARSDQVRLGWQMSASYQRLGELDKAIAALERCVDLNRELGRSEGAKSAAAQIDRLRSLQRR